MHARDHSLEVVFSQRQQWVVPIYQRDYAWSSEPNMQLPQIWEDIQARAEEIMEGRGLSPHFVGAIIYAEPDEPQPFGAVQHRYIVDGQQRITTCKLVLCAIKEVAHGLKLGSIADTISPLIFNKTEDVMAEPNREYYKLWPSSVDREYYMALSNGGIPTLRNKYPDMFNEKGKLNDQGVPEIVSAYCYLVKEIREYLESDQQSPNKDEVLSSILTGMLSGFQLVVVQLGKKDDPQSIFASLNGNAKPLSAFDLIRNDIFHRASNSSEDETELYEGRWKFLEDKFWKESVKQGRLKRSRTDHLMAHTLVAEMAKKIDVSKVAKEYQSYVKERNFETVEAEVDCLLRYAGVYESLEKSDMEKPQYQISKFLKIWDISAFHPLILWVGTQDIEVEEKKRVYQLIERYIVRRDMCDLSRQNYNHVIPGIIRSLQDNEADDIYSCVLSNLLSHTAKSSRLPKDSELEGVAETFDVYNQLSPKKLSYILFEIEKGLVDPYIEEATVDLERLTIEHIMPIKWKDNWLSPEKDTEINVTDTHTPKHSEGVVNLKQELINQRQKLIHTIGNLTLTSGPLNSRNSNLGWDKKRVLLEKHSKLNLNSQLCNQNHWEEWNQKQKSYEVWNEVSIKERCDYLYERINEIWPYPIQQ